MFRSCREQKQQSIYTSTGIKECWGTCTLNEYFNFLKFHSSSLNLANILLHIAQIHVYWHSHVPLPPLPEGTKGRSAAPLQRNQLWCHRHQIFMPTGFLLLGVYCFNTLLNLLPQWVYPSKPEQNGFLSFRPLLYFWGKMQHLSDAFWLSVYMRTAFLVPKNGTI